ncbi:MAG TPA: hypothetical protein VHR41_16775 [Gemmatimonadales bacterium]|jgi:hypothetical protein|nr:hypothetical protein [Gemmatimonadales bacterium]
MRIVLLSLLVLGSALGGARAVDAQAAPTLPSDTLQANYAPRSRSGPTPELAPTLPSDTLQATPPSAPDSAPPAMREETSPPATPPTPDSAHPTQVPDWAPWLLVPPEPPTPGPISVQA